MKVIKSLLLGFALLATLSASVPKAPASDEDIEFTIYVFGKDSWTPFTGKSGVTFANSDDNVLSITNNGATVEFTGKTVGNSTISATIGEQTLKALVRVRAVEGGEGKKYITYNKPIKAYYVEYNGGAIDANKGKSDRGNPIAEACENKKYAAIHWGLLLGDSECWVIEATAENGTVMSGEYNKNGSMQWITDNESADANYENSIDWRTTGFNAYEYPLGRFAAWISAYKGHKQNFLKFNDLWYGVAQYPDVYALPEQTEVTELYIKSEAICGIVCDVYKDTDGTDYIYTFWVDPATGFTLKFEQLSLSDHSISDSYEVTKLLVGSPEWSGLHLHFRNGDTLTNIHQ